MCDGDLNTQLSDVQFGMRMTKDDVKLLNITATFTFPYISRIRGFTASSKIITLNSLSNKSYSIKDKSFTSLSDLFDDVCAYFTHDITGIDGVNFGDGYGYFR